MTDLSILSVKELVRYHNAIVGVKPINIWKESKTKLLERIAAAKRKIDVEVFGDKPTKPAKIVEAAKATVKADLAAARREHKAEVKADARGERKSREVGVVGAFAKSHSLNPKVLRAALRRAGYNAPYTVAQLEKLVK